ncbi:MAG: cysteine desulfurase family protein [bacterium]
MKRYYFDFAGSTPLDQAVAKKMQVVQEMYGNPSSLHAEGRAARTELDASRSAVAQVLGARASEIIFTSGSTEADNLAIFGSVTAAGQPQAEVITIGTEHAAIQACCNVIVESGYRVHRASVDHEGRINISEIKQLITDATVLISIALGNSEIGTIQPIAKLGQLVQAVRTDRLKRGIKIPLSLHTDASACGGLTSLAVEKLGVDLMTVSSPKVYGPHGSAALYVRTGTPLTPVIIGGGQESGIRAGTENIAAISGFALALTKAKSLRKSEVQRLELLRDQLWGLLKDSPGIRRNGSVKYALPHILNVSFSGSNGEDIALKLDAAGFAVATGAACAESNRQPSHVLREIGLSDDDAQGSLRISLGRSTNSAMIDSLVRTIKKVVQ